MSVNNENPNKTMKRRMILLAVLLILAVSAYIIGSFDEKNNQSQKRGIIQEDVGILKRIEYQKVKYIEKPAMKTILLLGMDRTNQDQRYGARQGGQADFLMLLAIDHGNKKIYQLQIDRDTMTDVNIYGILGNELGTRVMQICLAHGFGATIEENNQNTVDAVQYLLQGIPIDYYLTLNMESIGILNDALGGVTVTLEDNFTAYDPLMTEGKTMRLNASQAEIFTRFRLEVGNGTNESRMIRQRAFMSAAGALLKECIIDQPDYIGELFDRLKDVMTTNISRGQLINQMNTAYNYEVRPVEMLPGEHSISEDGFMEFYAKDDAAIQWVLQVFYKPVD
jgi:LCP family protein required for cell wall assembly